MEQRKKPLNIGANMNHKLECLEFTGCLRKGQRSLMAPKVQEKQIFMQVQLQMSSLKVQLIIMSVFSINQIVASLFSRKPLKIVTTDVLFCSQPKDIQFTIIEKDRNEKIFPF